MRVYVAGLDACVCVYVAGFNIYCVSMLQVWMSMWVYVARFNVYVCLFCTL